jgi:hypothetical protein
MSEPCLSPPGCAKLLPYETVRTALERAHP